QAVEEVPGIALFMQPVQDLTIDDRISRTQFQLLVESADGALLERWVPLLLQRLSGLPQLADVASNLQSEGLKTFIEVNRDSAARLGVSMAAIDDALYSAF